MEITDNILDLLARTHTLTKSIVDVDFGLQSRRQRGNGGYRSCVRARTDRVWTEWYEPICETRCSCMSPLGQG
jgi:hypothetical protein